MQRSFTRRQRRQLWIESGNRCACCGGDLGVDWEADHVYPWSMGGETVLENAQALCRACNRRKGNRMVASSNLRPWQAEASDQAVAALQSDAYRNRAFLTVATMGAGKTRYAADVARRMFAARRCRRVIVVVPTLSVVSGWQNAMSAIGIELDDKWKGDRALVSDFHGVIATYQSVLQDSASSFVKLARDSSTMLIADEVHHGGVDGAWGDALERVGLACSHRLFLTGTPIRSDNKPMPMVEYAEKTDGKRKFYEVVPDYTYEYRDALRDGVVRPVRFHLEDSGVEFGVEKGDEQRDIFSYSLMERMAPSDESSRLKAALEPNENLMRQMIATGDQRISELRNGGIDDAAGIVTCLGIGHANQVAGIVREISGEKPTVVHSDDPSAQQKITAFRTSRKRWIVSIKMVSEGVDIPRLLVGVFATNVVAPLFFKQFVGRCVRVRPDEGRIEAYIIAPKIPAYHENAKEFEDAVRHLIQDVPDREREPKPPGDQTYVTTYATMPHGTTIVANGVEVPAAFFDYARQLFPYAPPGEIFVAAYSMYATGASVPQISAPSPLLAPKDAKPETAAMRLKRKKDERAQYVNRMIKIASRLFPERQAPMMVNQNFKRAWGNRGVGDLSIAEIEQQIETAHRIVRQMDSIEHEPAEMQRKRFGYLLSGMGSIYDATPYRHSGDAVADPVAERARALGSEGQGRRPVP